MRYFVRDSTLFLRGDFSAASSGIGGGIRQVSTIFNHTVPKDFSDVNPLRYMGTIITQEGYADAFFGLLTAVEMRNLCILQYDFITAFVTAGVADAPESGVHTINIIIYCGEGLAPAALLESIIVATEAKVKALSEAGFSLTGTGTDAVVVAGEGEIRHQYAGTLTEPGRRIYTAVQYGVQEALKHQREAIERTNPSFFIYSRYGGGHWAEWRSEECPYYPCHFEGQRCDFCYCPFYPCLEVGLGSWVESSTGGEVWSCSDCRLLHEPRITDYLKKHPEAPLCELKALFKRLKK
ncbi:MAG: adenosylcobinamide amidohydrolase [Methanomicrobiales archaeon]|nr:adenosylcobinamide amidohydrolase [Methanomicrobiales archaeon]